MSDKYGDKKPKMTNTFNSNLIISDLDGFFKNIYDYYYNRGYNNILAGTLLDNISFLFCIHFIIFNIYIVDWKQIIYLCVYENKCNIDVIHYVSLEFYDNNFLSFSLLYSLLAVYYLVYLWKSLLFLFKMKMTKSLYENKLRIKQKEMENLKFDDVLVKLLDLQKRENFCRVKENLTKFDIIARILRRENFLIALIGNKIIDFEIKFPFIGEKNIFSNYVYNNLSECLLKFAFLKGDVNINQKFFHLRFLQLKLFLFMLTEILFLPSIIFFKIIFWVFKNADNIKSNRNITQKIWSSYIQVMFRNYNELQHHFENRINSSYDHVEKFINCFKARMFSIIGKFLVIICGSFLVLAFTISSIDERLLTDLKFMGKKFVWITFVIGILLGIFGGNSNVSNIKNPEEDYLENIVMKENLYKNIVNKVCNIPYDFNQIQNMSVMFKKISNYYGVGIVVMMKELISVLFFPVIWIKIIFQAHNIIKFFKMYSKNVDGLGTIYSYSIVNVNNYRCLKEKDYNITETNFNDRKFINSFICFCKNFNTKSIEEELDFEMCFSPLDEMLDNQYQYIEDSLFGQYKKELKFKNIKESRLDNDQLESNFREFMYYHISQMNINGIFTTPKELIINSTSSLNIHMNDIV